MSTLHKMCKVVKPMRYFAALTVYLTGCPALVFGQNPYQEQGRSVVVSRSGIVATSQTLASQAGAMILLERGGSAVDAAIAANAVLGVAEPVT